MEKQQQRVLAYNLAKEIQIDELIQVSGGTENLSYCTKPSGHISGTNGSWDAGIDIVIDF